MEIAAPCTHLSRARGPKSPLIHLIKYLTWLFPWDQRLVELGAGGGTQVWGRKVPHAPVPLLALLCDPRALQSPSPPPSSTGWNLHPGGQEQGRASLSRVHQNKLDPNSARPALPAEGIPHVDKPSSLLPLLIQSPTQPTWSPRETGGSLLCTANPAAPRDSLSR